VKQRKDHGGTSKDRAMRLLSKGFRAGRGCEKKCPGKGKSAQNKRGGEKETHAEKIVTRHLRRKGSNRQGGDS